MAGWTGMIGLGIFFSVEEIDEKSNRQEDKEKNEIE
jgi:hypothetical protein